MLRRLRIASPLGAMLVIASAVSCLGTTACAPTPGMSPADMRPHMWKERVVLVFSPTANEPRLASQRQSLAADPRGFADRKLVTYEIVGPDDASSGGRSLGPLAAADFRERYAAPVADFEVVVIGIDGFVKHRSAEVLPAPQLFELIDAMPLRQAELRTPAKAATP